MGNAKTKSNEKSLLTSHDLKGIAEYIKSGKCKKISILAGAGISVSAGIPDFRSKNGFYNTLNLDEFPTLSHEQKEKIKENPQNILRIELFETNPEIYMMLRRDMILSPNKYSPTLTHWFFKLLSDKTLLKRYYSTNIDGLDITTNIPSDLLIHVHGTLGKIYCHACNQPYNVKKFRKLVEEKAYLKGPIRCELCNGTKYKPNYVKPGTVLFGQPLPDIYFDLVEDKQDLKDVDLLIIAGSSLKVRPSSLLPNKINKDSCVRLLCNRDSIDGVFDFKCKTSNDVFYKGNCDDGFLKLATLLGWKDDLMKLVHSNDMDEKENDSSKIDNNIQYWTKEAINNKSTDRNITK